MRAILTLHGVDDSGSVLSTAPAALRGLLRGIRGAGHAVVPLAELLADPAPDRVALTFDDGFHSLIEHALPVLEGEGARATLFLTTGYVGRDNGWPGQPRWAPRFPMLSWHEVEKLAAAGWEVESHTMAHPDLRRLSDAALAEELEGAREHIAQRLGRRPEGLAYPYGTWDARVARAAAAAGHRYAVTTRLATLDGPLPEPFSVPRLDAFYLRAAWLQRRFGDGLFRGWLGARALARRLRGR